MRTSMTLGVAAVALLFMGSAQAADDFKSGPQKVTVKVKPYNPLHCSGKGVGGKQCLV